MILKISSKSSSVPFRIIGFSVSQCSLHPPLTPARSKQEKKGNDAQLFHNCIHRSGDSFVDRTLLHRQRQACKYKSFGRPNSSNGSLFLKPLIKSFECPGCLLNLCFQLLSDVRQVIARRHAHAIVWPSLTVCIRARSQVASCPHRPWH